tara:strand:- start:619 stop:852 length:234 start_codon:yes stop_codon:yes gene_type:complete
MNYLNGSGRFDNIHGDEHLLTTDEEVRNVFLDSFQLLSDRVDWLAKTSWLPDGDDLDALENLAFFVDIAIRAKKKTL